MTDTTLDPLAIESEMVRLKTDLESLHGCKSKTRTDNTAFSCDACGKLFNFRASLCTHRKSCTKNEINDDMRYTELQKRFDSLQEQVEDLRQRPITTNTTTNYSDNRVVNNTNVQINALGHEDLTGITPQLLDTCIRRTTKGLVELMEKIHFDTGASNQNLRASLQHPEQVEYHDGDSWKYGPKSRVIRQVVDSSHILMSNRYDDSQQDLRKSMSHAMYEFIDRWMNKMTKSNAQIYLDVMSEVYCSILNRTREFGEGENRQIK